MFALAVVGGDRPNRISNGFDSLICVAWKYSNQLNPEQGAWEIERQLSRVGIGKLRGDRFLWFGCTNLRLVSLFDEWDACDRISFSDRQIALRCCLSQTAL